MPRRNPSDRRAKLEAHREKLNQEIQRLRCQEQQQQRKDDTRRKVLVGAMIFENMEDTQSDQWPTGRLIDALDAFLTRDRDRALFGLPSTSNADSEPPESNDNDYHNDRGNDDLDSWLPHG